VVEKDENVAKELATKINGLVINGDGTEMLVLKDAGISEADVLLALTGDDKANLMTCEIAKSFNVPKIIALVNHPGNEELFMKLGIADIVPVTQQVANAIENMLLGGGVRVLAEIGDGEAKILEIVVGEDSKYANTSVTEVKGFVIAGIWREGNFMFPTKSLKLVAGDLVLVVVKTKDLEKVISEIR
jgi:trk system potassium uptake protein TrkA